MALYENGKPVSGLNSIPRLTLAQYNALNVKPEFWVRTDAPESYKKLSADQVSYDSNNTVKDKIDSMIPTRTQFTPNYGASSDLGYRNFFITDNSTFLEIHFCLRCQTAINADVDLITLPTIAQNKTPQYGVGIETSNNKSHIVYNNGNYMYLDGTNITADFNGVFAGTFRMSLI